MGITRLRRLTSDLDLLGSTAGMDGLEIPGKPHAVMSDFMRCYEARSLHALSLEVVDSVRSVERHVVRLDARFVTPYRSCRQAKQVR